jgi:aspartate-semialdehyde dehydrogenase
MERLRAELPEEHDLEFDWIWEGDETDEEAKIRAEARKILELPALPISATTVRVPVLVGHAQSVWVETEEPLAPEQAESLLAGAPGVRLVEMPTPAAATRTEDVLVGRIRRDTAAEGNGLVLFLACDNLVKGAALNALQIAELLLEPARAALAKD